MPELESPTSLDPRALLAKWANGRDEWVRFLAGDVLSTGRPVSDGAVAQAYELLRQEKALDERILPVVAPLSVEARQDETAPPLSITKLSNVHGVNALVSGAVIEPNESLTILYGENGTGKTGYSRIFKALAGGRTADEILGNIDTAEVEAQSASVEYQLGGEARTLVWAGERGVSPFTRTSIFDSFSVTAHVDEDLDYVYVPAALALFTHVVAAIQAVSAHIDSDISGLTGGNSTLLTRFPRSSSVYPQIETLGASTDLDALKAKASTDPKVEEKIDELRRTVAALQANTLGAQITARKQDQRVLTHAAKAAEIIQGFDVETYNQTVSTRAQLAKDYEVFRTQLFAAAGLPAKPDETWNDFIKAGNQYRRHLIDVGSHDADRCLYCRQPLADPARELLAKYSSYLEDKVSADIRTADGTLSGFRRLMASIPATELSAFVGDYEEREDKPDFFATVKAMNDVRITLVTATDSAIATSVDGDALAAHATAVDTALTKVDTDIPALEDQSTNRGQALTDKQAELAELVAAAELTRSWRVIETQVKDAKEVDRLRILKRPLAQLARAVTELSKQASDELINQSFDRLFLEECEALRAPNLKIQFVGREGAARRRKVLGGARHRPSKVLSEGEQKVLAMADFLAEARLADITAPVIFDDPVSSLDHRRINEVAERIANLSKVNQVIVFTHDIFFATTLLGILGKTNRISYFQITDEGGMGKVTPATGPRSDSLGWFKAEINRTIQAANGQDGEARDALVQRGYSLLRSWCEVFTETELLRGVTKRYQPNVMMGNLAEIKFDQLPNFVPRVGEIFDLACRYMEGHSQPLASLGVSATLSGLEGHWKELQDIKRAHDNA
jgi:energy-coupling factor transporter ATP-binding protein EcfA2